MPRRQPSKPAKQGKPRNRTLQEAERYAEAATDIIIAHAEWIHGHMTRRSPRLRYYTNKGSCIADYLMMFALLRYNGFNIFLFHHKGMIAAKAGLRRLLGRERTDELLQGHLDNLRQVCSYHYKRLDAEQRHDLARPSAACTVTNLTPISSM